MLIVNKNDILDVGFAAGGRWTLRGIHTGGMAAVWRVRGFERGLGVITSKSIFLIDP